MSTARYLATLSLDPAGLTDARLVVAGAAAAAAALTRQLRTGRIALWSDVAPLVSTDDGSAVVGDLFDHASTRPLGAKDEIDWAGITASTGARLTERYWGNYVAILSSNDGAAVVRAPFGDLGCWWVTLPDAVIVASDLALLRAATGRTFAVSGDDLACHLGYPDWRRTRTCLDGVRHLRGGERLRVARRCCGRDVVWSPWKFAGAERPIVNAHEAAHAVRNAVQLAVRARTSAGEPMVLLLSGGLDSAIVAACLRASETDFTCLNLVGDDAGSDEVRYARDVAEATGQALLTHRFDLAAIDVMRSAAERLPAPVARCFTQARDAAARDVAGAVGAGLLVDGGGGDNVFFGERTVAILADCLIEGGLDSRFWRTAGMLGDLAQIGVWRLALRALQRIWRRSPAPRHAPRNRYLSAAAREIVLARAPHPWFCPPANILPGRAAHAALLVPAQGVAEVVNTAAVPSTISPLISQPVIEVCLRIASWLWLEPGRDRAVARRAFGRDIPPSVFHRRSKGSPTGFAARIFERDRLRVRDMLLGGQLAALGLLDGARLSPALAGPEPVRDLAFVDIMELVDAEAWARAQG